MINKDELLFVVDEDNNPLEPKPRAEVHANRYWHRVAHIWITNSSQQILCQKRSMRKDSNPGKWEAFFGGHLNPGVSYLEGASKELEEELSIKATPKQLQSVLLYKREKGTEFQAVYHLLWDGDITTLQFEEDEIDQIAWRDINEVERLLLKDKDPNWSSMGYEGEIFGYLKKFSTA